MSMINWAKEEVRLACEHERKASGVEDDNPIRMTKIGYGSKKRKACFYF